MKNLSHVRIEVFLAIQFSLHPTYLDPYTLLPKIPFINPTHLFKKHPFLSDRLLLLPPPYSCMILSNNLPRTMQILF